MPKVVSTWIEMHSVFKKTIETERLIAPIDYFGALATLETSENRTSAVSQQLTRLVGDLTELLQDWGTHLMETPSIIWMEAGAFSHSPFFFTTTDMEIDKAMRNIPRFSGLSTVPLKTISRISLDGQKVGVLCIWPSK